jgi:hypothetical protein
MSYYAKVLNSKVIQVIKAEVDFFNYFVDSSPGNWIETSYNTKNGTHYGLNGQPDQGIALRGNFAGIGHVYDIVNDVFYFTQPYPSWILNKTTWSWESPITFPNDNKEYLWDESTKSWVLVSR